jgi:hypothetical protein
MKRKIKQPSAPLIVQIGLVVAIVAVIILVAMSRSGTPVTSSRCPIDGAMPEWTKHKTFTVCEFGHFSVVEKTSHHWFGACQQ